MIIKEYEKFYWNHETSHIELVLREQSDYELEGYLRYEVMKDKLGDSLGDIVMIPISDVARLLLVAR